MARLRDNQTFVDSGTNFSDHKAVGLSVGVRRPELMSCALPVARGVAVFTEAQRLPPPKKKNTHTITSIYMHKIFTAGFRAARGQDLGGGGQYVGCRPGYQIPQSLPFRRMRRGLGGGNRPAGDQ